MIFCVKDMPNIQTFQQFSVGVFNELQSESNTLNNANIQCNYVYSVSIVNSLARQWMEID